MPEHERRVSAAFLTLCAAPVAGLNVGLMALTDPSPADADRLPTLRSGRRNSRDGRRKAQNRP